MTDISMDVDLSLKDLLVSIGWFLTILGWIVSNWQANRREVRKEVRHEVEACSAFASGLMAKSRGYFTVAPAELSGGPLAEEIKFDLHRLIVRVERIERKYPKFELSNAVGELYESITSGSFESASRVPVTANDPLLQKIDSDVHFVIDRLEDGFAATFR